MSFEDYYPNTPCHSIVEDFDALLALVLAVIRADPGRFPDTKKVRADMFHVLFGECVGHVKSDES